MKNKKLYIIGGLVIVAIVIYFLTRKKKITPVTPSTPAATQSEVDSQRQYLLRWANTDSDPAGAAIRVQGINAMTDAEIPSLYQIVSVYFTKNIAVPADLQTFWDYASAKYGIDGHHA